MSSTHTPITWDRRVAAASRTYDMLHAMGARLTWRQHFDTGREHGPERQPTVRTLAQTAYEAFEVATRDDGSPYIRVREDAPGWVQELVYDAHRPGDMLPDDHRYDLIHSACEDIAEADDPEDSAHEWADAMVDAYTGARIAWLASHAGRAEYCDQAAEDMGVGADMGIAERIGLGQYEEAREVHAVVLAFLQDRADER